VTAEPVIPSGGIFKPSNWRKPIDARRGLVFAFSGSSLMMLFIGMGEWQDANNRALRMSYFLGEHVAPDHTRALAGLAVSGVFLLTSLAIRPWRKTATAASVPAPRVPDSLTADLAAVVKMHADGALTDDEFRIVKARLLSDRNP
jgi:hypothetical protein